MRTPLPVVEVLSLPGCPGLDPTLRLVNEVVRNMAPGAQIRDHRLTEGEARARGFPGSPTVLVNGRDIEGRGPHVAGVA